MVLHRNIAQQQHTTSSSVGPLHECTTLTVYRNQCSHSFRRFPVHSENTLFLALPCLPFICFFFLMDIHTILYEENAEETIFPLPTALLLIPIFQDLYSKQSYTNPNTNEPLASKYLFLATQTHIQTSVSV